MGIPCLTGPHLVSNAVSSAAEERAADPQVRRRELRPTPTLAVLVSNRYLPHAKATKRSWRFDETILRIHILPALGHLTLDQIGSELIAELIKRMRAKGYAPGTDALHLQSRSQMERAERHHQPYCRPQHGP